METKNHTRKKIVGFFLLLMATAGFSNEKIIRSYSNDGNYTLWGMVKEIPKAQRNENNGYCALYFQTYIHAANDAQKKIDPGQYYFDLCTTKVYDWTDFVVDLENKKLPDSVAIKVAYRLNALPKKKDLNNNSKVRYLTMEPGRVIFSDENDSEIALFTWVQEEKQ